MALDVWDDYYDFEEEDFDDEEWDEIFEQAEIFEIKKIEYKKHISEIHEYCKLGLLEYPFEIEDTLFSDLVLN